MGILNNSGAYLFPENDLYTHISANSAGNYYRIIRKKAGINNLQQSKNGRGACLHCFRHTFAVRSFDKTNGEALVRENLFRFYQHIWDMTVYMKQRSI